MAKLTIELTDDSVMENCRITVNGIEVLDGGVVENCVVTVEET